ncbi:MAG: hypothetical protein RL227_2805 [Pseudomonadota bacterium]|jgi:hypothetical protein
MLRRARRLAAWIALAAVGLGLLLPAWAQAVGGSGATAWTEICTAQGMNRVPVLADGATDGPAPVSPDSAMAHCPWCLLAAAPAWAPPPATPVWPMPAAGHGRPDRFFTAARTPHAWRPSQPRGPPVLPV